MDYAKIITVISGLLLSTAVSQLHAEEHEHEQHGTHEHGIATLAIAVGDEGVEIILESPAANLLGFEHAANSDADKQKLAEVITRLKAGDLFNMNEAAGCELRDTAMVSALLDNQEAHADGEKHAEHEHEEDDDTHSDMEISWSFACAKPDKVEAVSVKLFSAFPQGFEHIKAEWITDTGASAQKLQEDSIIRLN